MLSAQVGAVQNKTTQGVVLWRNENTQRYKHWKQKLYQCTNIVSMHECGKTHREIAEHFGLERIQIKKCMERFRHRQ